MSLMDTVFRKNAPTSEDWGIASALKSLKGELALVKAKQLADPDNLTDPDDRAVMAALNEAEQAIDRAIVAQSKDGRGDDVAKAALTAAGRKDLDDSDFVFPATRNYPIPDASHARNALARVAQHGTPEEQAKVKAAVAKKFPGIEVTKSEDFEITVDLIKSDAQRLVYGVVLSPSVRDSQGDISTAEDIEKAAHEFLDAYTHSHDIQHDDVTKNADGDPLIRTVESYIAPTDMTIEGQQVLKGAWIIAGKVMDDAAWSKVEKGELTGWSIAGTGVRLPDSD